MVNIIPDITAMKYISPVLLGFRTGLTPFNFPFASFAIFHF